MKAFYYIINRLLAIRRGYGKEPERFGTPVEFAPKLAGEWGSKQNGSVSVSIADNFARHFLKLKREQTAGYTWSGLPVVCQYSGAEAASEMMQIKSVSVWLDLRYLKQGSWAGFWVYNDRSEVDFEMYDGKRIEVTFHWVDKKGRKFSLTNRIPMLASGVFTIKPGRMNKCYVNNRLVAIFPHPKQTRYRVYLSMYAHDDAEGSLLYYQRCMLDKN